MTARAPHGPTETVASADAATAARATRIVPLVVACGFFMEGFDGTVITTALPVMAIDLGATPIELSLAVTAYMMSLAVFIPISGWLADRYGMKTVFRSAVGLFTVASVLCAVSQTLEQLVAARVLLGASGAMMAPVGRLVVLRSVPKADFVKAMAFVTTPALVGALIGPPVGGFVTTYVSWRWIFVMNVPVGLLGILAITLYIREYKPAERRPLDWIGFALTTLAVVCLAMGLEMAARPGQSVQAAGLLAGGIAACALIYLHSRRTPHPLMKIDLFRIATFNVATVSGFLYRLIVGGVPFLLPVLLQVGFGMTAFVSGLLLLSMAVGIIAMKAATPVALRRYGYRRLLICNSLLSTAAIMACLAFDATTPVAVICAVFFVYGCCRSLQVSALQSLTYADMPTADMSGATSFSNAILQFGAGAGVALSAVLMYLAAAWRGGDPGNLQPIDVQTALFALAVVSLLSTLPLLRMARDAGEELSGYRAVPARPAGE